MNLIEIIIPLEIIIPFFLTTVLLIAAASDIRSHKIPNWLTYPAMLTGIVYHSMVNGIDGLLLSITGVVVGIKEVRLPYGIAIALGTLFSVFMMNKLSGLVRVCL